MKMIELDYTTGIIVFRDTIYIDLFSEISDEALYSSGPIRNINDTLYSQLFINLESVLTTNFE